MSTVPIALGDLRSFLLQFNPVDGRFRLTRITGKVQFDRPVPGVIVRCDKFVQNDSRFLQRETESQASRVLELGNTRISDDFTLSDDRRTVKLNLMSAGLRVDHVRVIVDDSYE